MGKLMPSHMMVKGKVGDKVFVPKGKYKDHWRNAPAYIAKSSLAALKIQQKRAPFINKLGSEINTIIGGHCKSLKSRDFYRRTLSRFYKEPVDNRYMLLRQLKEMQVHERYTCRNLSGFNYEIKGVPNEIIIELQTTFHYTNAIPGTNCYYYELLLISWSKKDRPVEHSVQFSDWVQFPGPLPKYIFKFTPAVPASQWLLCIGQKFGKDKIDDHTLAMQGMEIVETGTFERKDLAILEKSMAVKAKKQASVKKTGIIERVKAVGHYPESTIMEQSNKTSNPTVETPKPV
jgi:hypothetical protein